MRRICQNRGFVSFVVGSAVWFYGYFVHPFDGNHDLFALMDHYKPHIYQAIRWSYTVMWFTTPGWLCLITLSALDVFLLRYGGRLRRRRLPTYPDPAARQELFLVLGEVHHRCRPELSASPQWLLLPEKGLCTGVAVFGATGTGKTSGCMRPFAEQLLGFRADDPERKLSALVLEVKGDFCRQVQEMLRGCERQGDYLEISLDGPCRYNPLHNDLEAGALACGIASLLSGLVGKGREAFWQQACTNLVKFVILLCRTLEGYATLFDIYECVTDPDRLQKRIKEGKKRFAQSFLSISTQDYMGSLEVDELDFKPADDRMRTADSSEARAVLQEKGIPFEVEQGSAAGPEEAERRERFEAVQRWFERDWMQIKPQLRASIVGGVSPFLSLFHRNPDVRRIFCPPKECYDPLKNGEGRYGIPLPPFSELIDQGKVVALNIPDSANPGLARAVGVFIKQDFQRSMLDRIPKMAAEPQRRWREVLFLCNEYDSFATVGRDSPTCDWRFFALSSQARCIPLVATQSISSLRSALPGESWRTLLQAFRTKVFLALSDDFSAKFASELCDSAQYSISESVQHARQTVFGPKAFAELQNAQAIVLAYDGSNPLPPTYCYLKPNYLDPDSSYFEQLKKGEI